MCGIGGFSLAPGSKINSRALSNALLTEMEYRGTNASGYAFACRDGSSGWGKDPIPGSQLGLKGMPRNADTVILHTRMATHGTHENNANNHPVPSPMGNIQLVHNGVIYNHDDARQLLTKGETLPEVDTSVIPAVLEEFGTDGFAVLAGDAAVAWLDLETSNTLHLAKLSHSPVSIARLLDGSFVFASTDKILATALVRAGLQWIGNWPDTFEELRDGDYLQVVDSEVSTQPNVEWYDDYWTSTNFTSFRSTTDGGLPSSNSKSAAWVQAWEREDEPGFFDENNIWRDFSGEVAEYAEEKYTVYGTAAPMALTAGASLEDMFYAVDHEGDYSGYRTIETLLNNLKWQSGMGAENILTADGYVRWVNHYLDVGEVLDDGTLNSWIHNPDYLNDYDSTVGTESLQFVRDGLNILKHVMAS